MLYRYFILSVAACILYSGCSTEKMGPVNGDDQAPKPVTNVLTESLNGAVRITYQLPDDPDLLYVAAEYTTRDAKPRVFKSSFFNSYIVVDGFSDASEYEVRLYAVDRGDNRSEPVVVKVIPLTPPVVEVFNLLEVSEDFGGININFVNDKEAEIGTTIIIQNQFGDWEPLETYYTQRKAGSFSVRGLPAEPATFGFFVTDKWDNTSDTLWQQLTPLFEEELDKGKFRELTLPTDAGVYQSNGPRRLWDGSAEEPNFQRTAAGDMPHHITFDLGVTAKLSRFLSWQRVRYQATILAYGNGNPREFEIWGTSNPASNGSFDGWTKLMDCVSVKPSGLPSGQVSNEDIEYASRGEEFRLPLEAPAVRYIRIKFINTWGATNFAHFAEMTFYGQVIN